MRGITLLTVLLFIIRTSLAQDTILVEVSNHQKGLDLLNKSFHGLVLVKDSNITSIESKLQMKAESVAGCLTLLMLGEISIYSLSPVEVNAIKARLLVVADSLVAQHQPLLILNQGLNSVEHADRLNNQHDSYNITYVSMGNSCTSYNKLESEGVVSFNERVLQDLGLDKWPVKEGSSSLQNSKKNRNKKKTM